MELVGLQMKRDVCACVCVCVCIQAYVESDHRWSFDLRRGQQQVWGLTARSQIGVSDSYRPIHNAAGGQCYYSKKRERGRKKMYEIEGFSVRMVFLYIQSTLGPSMQCQVFRFQNNKCSLQQFNQGAPTFLREFGSCHRNNIRLFVLIFWLQNLLIYFGHATATLV